MGNMEGRAPSAALYLFTAQFAPRSNHRLKRNNGALLVRSCLRLAAAAISFILYSFGSTSACRSCRRGRTLALPVKVVAALAAFWAMARQIGSFLVGGYIAGRMRSHWSDAPPHEARFRDEVHGLLVGHWAWSSVPACELTGAKWHRAL